MGSFADFNNFQSKSFTYDLICLAIQAGVFLFIALYIENLRFRLKDRQAVEGIEPIEDVQQRGSFYDADHINTNDEIFIEHLYKKYSNGFTAIRDNSFSVKKG